MIAFNENGNLEEVGYDLAEEPKAASLLTTGNGYMGVRGSLEEFGSTKIQGAFIRGYIDEIVEIVEPFCDNIYMKKYYIDEEKLKHFDKQVSCINLPDFLLIRFRIGGKVFYPWEGEVLSWTRTLDTEHALLVRRVTWKDDEGNITEFVFERFASYADKHKYYQRATAVPVNHDLPVEAISGIDTAVRTNGQKILRDLRRTTKNSAVGVSFSSGEKYAFRGKFIVNCLFWADGKICSDEAGENEDLIYRTCWYPCAKKYMVEKEVCLYTERDVDISESDFDTFFGEAFSYENAYRRHCERYNAIRKKFDIQIGDDAVNAARLRFANYHTIISANDLDCVHGISAKGLTGEKYNQFVWWDADIYQMPVFTHAYPEEAKNLLMYRYRMLDASRENAKKEGRRGARYAFVSAVEGKEHVWIYARHPFLQIHINSDVAFGIIDYFRNTDDLEFMKLYGMEMLYEIGRYWIDRVTYKNGRYEILDVTGTDEHHPYVDNDAYTNYETAFVLKKIVEYDGLYDFSEVKKKTGITEEELRQIGNISEKMYLPLDETGLVPQFDGYFSLTRALEVSGNGSGTNFQMKQAGLYHKSQVIKQPDVMLLFSYLNIDVPGADYFANWDYYEKMCESSSSLTFPVHAICSALADRPLSFLEYFCDSTEIDIKDIHRCAYQGVHSGCLAGAWMSVFRGIFGISANECELKVDPHPIPFWRELKLRFFYHGKEIEAEMKRGDIVFRSRDSRKVFVRYNGVRYEFENCLPLKHGCAV